MGGKRVSLLPLLIFYISEFSPFFCVDPRIQFPRNPFFLSHRELSEAVRSNCRWDLRRIDSIKGSAWWNYSRVLWLNRKEMTLINERPAQSPVLFFLASHRATSHHEWNFRPLDDRAMRQIFDLTSLISLRTLPVTHFNRHLTLAYVPLRKECVENVNLYLNKFAAKNRRKVVFLYWKSGKVGRWWFTLAKSNGFMVFCPRHPSMRNELSRICSKTWSMVEGARQTIMRCPKLFIVGSASAVAIVCPAPLSDIEGKWKREVEGVKSCLLFFYYVQRMKYCPKDMSNVVWEANLGAKKFSTHMRECAGIS